jgi:hypothetical protein
MYKIRNWAIAGLLLAIATPAAAQSPAIGFKLGATFSNLAVSDDDGDETSTLTSFGGGGFIRFGLAGLGLQVDVLALTKGAEVSSESEGDAEIKLDYVEVPVQLVLGLGSGRFSPYLMVGPSFGFETGCEVSAEIEDEEFDVDCDEADFFERKSLDIGATAAAGLMIPLGPGSLLLEGRYTHGLTNIYDNEAQTNENDVKNRSWGVFGGYSVPLGRR